MVRADSLHIGCAQSDGQIYDWLVADDDRSVKCSMVAAADLNRHLDVDDRLIVLHVNAVDNAANGRLW